MSTDVEKITQRLAVDLTSEELLDRGEQLSMLLRQIDASEQERKAEDKRRKRTIGGLESDANEVGEQIRTKQERRDVQCEARYHLDRCILELVRLDTGEIVETKTMGKWEVERRRQTRMDLEQQAVEGDAQAAAGDDEQAELAEARADWEAGAGDAGGGRRAIR